MKKSELFKKLIKKKIHIKNKITQYAIKEILEYISFALANGERVEIRGFGSFSLHYRSSRIVRNPKTGEKTKLSAKYVPYFKPGKQLKIRINIYK
ncbi:Integration host factor subunit beta [Buchnera aphidicola (Protaphis terricola)]